MKTLKELGISPTPWTLGSLIIGSDGLYARSSIDDADDGVVAGDALLRDADARIMKASPKMYEALYLILRCWGRGILSEGGFSCDYVCTDEDARCTWKDCPILKKARAALAEASGEVTND